MTDWAQVSLGDVAREITVGHVGSMAEQYRESGVPFLRSQNVRPHRLDLDDVIYIDPAFHRSLPKSSLHAGDVVTVRTGAPGATAVVPAGIGDANCADLVITRPGEGLDARWLSYYVNAVTSTHIARSRVGAVQQHFNVGAMKELRLSLPSLPEQQAIAEVLGALDDKIAANRQAIASAGRLAEVQYLAACFRSAVLTPLSGLASFVNGKAFTKGATGTGRVVIRIAELNSGLGESTVRNDIEVADEHTARPGDLLFAWSGSLTVHRWYRDEAIVNQHIFKVIPREGFPLWVVNGAVRSKLAEFQRIAANKATTMGHIQRRHLDEPVPVPSSHEIRTLDEMMTSLWDRALAAEIENERLAATRDALLPLLMSGKVRVKDVEDEVGELV